MKYYRLLIKQKVKEINNFQPNVVIRKTVYIIPEDHINITIKDGKLTSFYIDDISTTYHRFFDLPPGIIKYKIEHTPGSRTYSAKKSLSSESLPAINYTYEIEDVYEDMDPEAIRLMEDFTEEEPYEILQD